jgi:Response regulator containing CheY-like receiver, AAA-type ATPase, and DNA-binding domains
MKDITMDEALRVLIVDDEDDFRETIVKRLNARKILAEGASSGIKALQILENKDFDVIVLDVKMPDMDGIETLRHIKKLKPKIEVIMLTGHASVEFGIKGMQLGAFDYVMKPAPLNELLDTIIQANNKKQASHTDIDKS